MSPTTLEIDFLSSSSEKRRADVNLISKRRSSAMKGGSVLRLATPFSDNNEACSSSTSSGFLLMGGGSNSSSSNSHYHNLNHNHNHNHNSNTTTTTTTTFPPPMTIFYNGTVHIYHVPVDKAEAIMRMAEVANVEEVTVRTPAVPSTAQRQRELWNGRDMVLLNGDLPLSRKLSLQRFFERRKERLLTASPYHC